MKRALVLTVGTGTGPDVDIEQPLMKTVKESHPDYTLFVATEASRKHAENIAKSIGLDPSEWDLCLLRHFDDVEEVFLEVCDAIREVVRQGFSPGDIQVDFTSGTKAMSAGAVLAAVHENCNSLKYITGKRQDGVVIDGTERFVSLRPHAVLANYDIKAAVELIKRLRFQPAILILAAIDPNLLGEDRKKLLSSLMAVAQAYDFWDRFEHIKFKAAIRKADWRFHELEPFRVDEQVIKSVHGIGQVLKKGSLAVTEEVILDLFNNAERRTMEGRYDDAVARLYRLTEMLAQHLLRVRHGIDTGNVDPSRAPAHFRKTLEAHRDTSCENRIKTGLRVSYELLAALGEEIGERYMTDSELRHLLNERNRTILAHGSMPVAVSLYRKLRGKIVELLKLEIHDFQARAGVLNFPWL